MRCSVYIATSVDGYIATPDGNIDWLHTAGNIEVDMSTEDMGFKSFLISVDCMIMGRKCMETIASMNLTSEQWPYGDMPIFVLSHTLKVLPEILAGKVEMHSGDIKELIGKLENRGLKHAYIDEGSTITSFIDLELMDEMTLATVPLLLGEGIPLFEKLNQKVKLEKTKAAVFANDFVQIKYSVNYS